MFEAFASTEVERPTVVVVRSRAVDDDDRWETIEITVWNRLDDEVLGGYLVQVRNLDEGRTLDDRAERGRSAAPLAHRGGARWASPSPTPPGRSCTATRRPGRSSGPSCSPSATPTGSRWPDPEHRAELADAFRRRAARRVPAAVTAAFGDERPALAPPAGGAAAQRRGRPHQGCDRHRRGRHRAGGGPGPAGGDPGPAAAPGHPRSAHRPAQPLRAARGARPRGGPSRSRRRGVRRAVLRPRRLQAGERPHAATRVATRCSSRWPTASRRAVRDGDIVARLGGDEFVVLCERVGDTTDVAERVARAAPRAGRGSDHPPGRAVRGRASRSGSPTCRRVSRSTPTTSFACPTRRCTTPRSHGPGRTTLRRAG